MERRDAIITSGWYAANIGGRHVPVDKAILGGTVAGALARVRIGRGLLIYRAARRGAGAALRRRERGVLTALVLAAVLGGARMVVLELIPDRPARSPWKRVLKRIWFRAVERPAVRRGMRAGQVLSVVERRTLAELYRIEPGRLVSVPWALCRTGQAEIDPGRDRTGVLASGRAACDWETLFEAARGRDWDLTVVCGAGDRDRVAALSADDRARVLVELPRDEHDALMRSAAVYAIPLIEDGLSSGQVRLMTAVELGAPVVASHVTTLRDYLVDGETALTVEPRDADALREAIETLLADRDRAEALAAAALDRARGRTYADYFHDVGKTVERALETYPRGPEGDPSPGSSPVRPGRS